MMTARQYRARADLIDQATEASSSEAVIFECRRMAKAWRRLATLADWQDGMRKKGHSTF
jgi:site-specific recombinase